MRRMEFQGRWVLVTGASSGLGEAFARLLAREHRANLLLVARRAPRLAALQQELEATHGVKVVPIVADLTVPSEAERIFRTAVSEHAVYAAVLNAGVTFYGPSLQQPEASFEQLLATNVVSVVALCKRFAPYFVERGEHGGILLVSSLAGAGPMPFQAAYAASKSFVTQYGVALRHELKPRGVSLTVVTPGGLATEMLELSGLSKKFNPKGVGMMSAARCARLSLQAFQRRRRLYVPGALNGLLAWAYKLLPQAMMVALVGWLYAPPATESNAAP